jgi:hypothetical protein
MLYRYELSPPEELYHQYRDFSIVDFRNEKHPLARQANAQVQTDTSQF